MRNAARLAAASVSILLCAVVVRAAENTPDPLAPEQINQRITQHRTAQASLTITAPDGTPLANAPVVVRQVRHKFLFGCNAFAINTANQSQSQQDYQQRFAALLNFATLPFYWGGYEPREGQPNFENRKMMANWCRENGIRTKGHPLCWHQVQPRWLIDKSLDDVQKLQLGRISREVGAFKSLVDTWDVVNEAAVMPGYKGEPGPIPALCQKLGQVELIKQTFAAARAANPNATLILNDYDTSSRYEKLIKDCLDAGVSIDVIGIQSHQHAGYWGAKRTWDVCERFAKFNKPLNFTETTIISGEIKRNINYAGRDPNWPTTPEGEARQEQQVAEFYTILFSHPAVKAITWWDFSDNAWLGAPAGLVRKDMSPKPAYDRLIKLIKGEWWTAEVKATTDKDGKVTFRGFLGDYSVESGGAKASFSLDKPGVCDASARLTAR